MTATMTLAEFKALPKRRAGHRVVLTPLDGYPVEFGALELPMTPPSLNNIFENGKKGRFKSAEYKAWQTRACLHLRKQSGWHVPGAIRVRLTFNDKRTRSDLDNLIKPTLDLLMAAGRISDDRNVRKIEAEFSPNIVGTLIEIRKLGVEAASSAPAPYSAKKMRSQIAASVAAIGPIPEAKRPAPAAEHKQRGGTADARHFRAQIPTSTDPDYLERMASAAEAARDAQ